MKNISNFLDTEIARRSHRSRDIQQKLGEVLTQDILQHVSYATLDNGKLTLMCDAPEWSGRLRFYQTAIEDVFARHGQKISEVKTQTLPPQANPMR